MTKVMRCWPSIQEPRFIGNYSLYRLPLVLFWASVPDPPHLLPIPNPYSPKARPREQGGTRRPLSLACRVSANDAKFLYKEALPGFEPHAAQPWIVPAAELTD